MSHGICPWWLGYFLVNPLRRFRHDPTAILSPWVSERMWVLEPGPGMGFFTLELARLVGPQGKVIAVDVQRKMIAALERRACKAGLQDRIDSRLANAGDMGLDDLDGKIDFVLAFAVIHELPDTSRFLEEVRRALRPGRKMFVAEPKGHVKQAEFANLQETARRTGFHVDAAPAVPKSWTAIFIRD